ncbi:MULTISPECIES: hypothetical protein [unclassified Streptomyces]|uniref:LexA family protein n=1 Tax=unclassified Streptomyces TaxID=2593676 RepID=UPI00332B5ED5
MTDHHSVRQKSAPGYIRERISETGAGPNIRQVRRLLVLYSTSSVAYHPARLETAD